MHFSETSHHDAQQNNDRHCEIDHSECVHIFLLILLFYSMSERYHSVSRDGSINSAYCIDKKTVQRAIGTADSNRFCGGFLEHSASGVVKQQVVRDLKTRRDNTERILCHLLKFVIS